MPGKIISFEGIEGTGKSTQIQYLQHFFTQKKIPSCTVREPGFTYIGEQIRHLLQLDPSADQMYPETELLLFEASRAQLIREFVIPKLKEGTWVLFDRFFDSSTAYQGAARHIPNDTIHFLNHFAINRCIPSLTILLDTDVDTALQRLNARQPNKDRIESESRSFFQNVREGYLELARREPQRFFVVDATLSPTAVSEQIQQHVQSFFNL